MNSLLNNFAVFLCVVSVSGCGGGGGGGGEGGGSSAKAPINVSTPAAARGSAEAHIQWNAPTQLLDGSAAVGNIAGYNVYSLATGAAACPVDISLYAFVATVTGSPVDPQTYTDTGLVAGAYCYAVTALNFSAQESLAAFLAIPLSAS